jgi:hypothetical protein
VFLVAAGFHRVLPAAEAAAPEETQAAAKGTNDSDRWTIGVSPYVFLPEVTTNVTIGGMKAKSKMSMGDVLDDLEMGGMLRLEAIKKRWGFYLDFEYSKLSDEIEGSDAIKSVDIPVATHRSERTRRLARRIWSRLSPAQRAAALRRLKAALGSAAATADRLKSALNALTLPHIDEVDIELVMIILEAGTFYRLVDRPLPHRYARHVQFDLTGGARYVYLKTTVDIDLTPGSAGLLPSSYEVEESKDYIEPVLGARTRLAITDRLLVNVRGDVGGFGIGSASDFTWQVVAGLGYQITDRTLLSAGYRQLDIDYKSSDLEVDMCQKGPFVACTIRF